MMGPRRDRAGRKISGLSGETRALLSRGAGYWTNGPAHVSDDLAQLMNLQSARKARQMLEQVKRDLDDDEPVTAINLTRVLFLTEIGISSTVLGPSDWHNTYGGGRDDDEAMHVEFSALMEAQDELAGYGVPRGIDPFHRGRRGAT